MSYSGDLGTSAEQTQLLLLTSANYLTWIVPLILSARFWTPSFRFFSLPCIFIRKCKAALFSKLNSNINYKNTFFCCWWCTEIQEELRYSVSLPARHACLMPFLCFFLLLIWSLNHVHRHGMVKVVGSGGQKMLQSKVDVAGAFTQGSFSQGSAWLCLIFRHLKWFFTES